MYLSSLVRYVNSTHSRALTYPLYQSAFSAFWRMPSSSFSASVQARDSTFWKKRLTESTGIELLGFTADFLPPLPPIRRLFLSLRPLIFFHLRPVTAQSLPSQSSFA